MQTSLPSLPTTITKENRYLYCLLATSLVSLFFILSSSSTRTSSSSSSVTYPFGFRNAHQHLLLVNPNLNNPSNNPLPPTPPSLAYYISGSNGDADRILRLLFSIYHPRNQYLLHLDNTALQSQRDQLALSVQSVPLFRAAQNVNVIGKADFANPSGSSSISSTLHGAAILLRLSANWDWFINLSAADYPLVTQDDLLHIMSFLPKDLNFVNHTSYIGWRESRRLKPIIVDPGLYLSEKSEIFYATQKRDLPDAYRLFTGSSFAMLSRKFIEFCILGSDNLPRTLLMYLSNTPSSQPNYFPTILCNSQKFNKTTVNNNMQYSSWDQPPKFEPRALGLNDFDEMIKSGAVFGTQFLKDDPVLDRIDQEILNRSPGSTIHGGWCLDDPDNGTCTVWGDADILKPGPGAKRLERRIVELLSNGTFHSHQCIVE